MEYIEQISVASFNPIQGLNHIAQEAISDPIAALAIGAAVGTGGASAGLLALVKTKGGKLSALVKKGVDIKGVVSDRGPSESKVQQGVQIVKRLKPRFGQSDDRDSYDYLNDDPVPEVNIQPDIEVYSEPVSVENTSDDSMPIMVDPEQDRLLAEQLDQQFKPDESIDFTSTIAGNPPPVWEDITPTKMVVTEDTYLKVLPSDSGELKSQHLWLLLKNTELDVVSYRQIDDHHQLTFLQTEFPRWYVESRAIAVPRAGKRVEKAKPTILVEAHDPTVVKLPVTYYSQLDNATDVFGPGHRQCNTSSCAMLLNYCLGGLLDRKAEATGADEESFYDDVVAQYGDTTEHNAQTLALRQFGIESEFRTDLPLDFLKRSLSAGYPVVVGLIYKKSGHIAIVVGHDPRGKKFFLHDPYGERRGDSNVYAVGQGGIYSEYSYSLMSRIWNPAPKSLGWGRVVKAVQGVPTGLTV